MTTSQTPAKAKTKPKTKSSSAPKLLGFGGLLESGKDAVADHLVDNHGFTKVNMSDPIDRCVQALNPIVAVAVKEQNWFTRVGHAIIGREPEIETFRYQEVRNDLGFTEAKKLPEIRSLLQKMGVEVGRNIIDPNIWVNLARRTITSHRDFGTPVVLSGVRFVDEQQMIKDLEGQLIWVDRPGHHSAATGSTAGHSSEVTFDGFDQDLIVTNDGTLDDLYVQADGLVR